jgi:hypothetical protein
MIHCHHCYTTNVDKDSICDRCDEHYCWDCSYTFSIHYQHEGARCYYCADQARRTKLTKQEIRENKLLLLNLKSVSL